MTNIVEESVLVRNLLEANASMPKIWWPNEQFRTPAPRGSVSNPAVWMAVSVTDRDGEAVSFETGDDLVEGLVHHEIYVEKGAGETKHGAVVLELQETYAVGDVDTMKFGVPAPGVARRVGEIAGGWFRWDFDLPFVRLTQLSP